MELTESEIKKIVSNKNNAIDVLTCLETDYPYKELMKMKSEEVYELLNKHFKYDVFHNAIRLQAFRTKYSLEKFEEESIKYNRCIEIINTEYNQDKSWAFHPSTYEDNLIKCIRKYKDIDEARAENKINADRNLVIKAYNNSRSFLYEYFLVRNHPKILPTLSNSKGLDIFINQKWDIKNTSGVTSEFKKDFGENWMEHAINNPKLVAEYLFKNQGDDRFNCDDRIFLIDLSHGMKEISEIEKTCKNIEFDKVYEINFEKIINGIKNDCSAKAMVVYI